MTVLEASGSIGGRVRSVPGFVRGFSVEAGATYIHGTSHAVYEHAVANSWRLHHADFPSYLYLPAHDAPGTARVRGEGVKRGLMKTGDGLHGDDER